MATTFYNCITTLLSLSTVIVGNHGFLSNVRCPCVYISHLKATDCSKRGLLAIPDCVRNETSMLDVSDNGIIYKQGQFNRFKALTYLDLSSNSKFSPGNDSFIGLKHLQVLYLNHTALDKLQTSIFTEPTDLKILSVRCSRQRHYFPVDFFNQMKNLTHLDFSENFGIEDAQFLQLSNLLYLDASELGKPSPNFGKDMFKGLSSLEILILYNCKLGPHFNKYWPYAGLHHLKHLDLSMNNLGIEPMTFVSIFQNCSSLEYLDLSYNSLKRLPAETFTAQRNLRRLVLEENDLREITFDIKTLRSLKILDLSYNQIQSISSRVIKQIEQIAKHTDLVVYLLGNPLICNCEHIDFVNLIRNKDMVPFLDNFACKFENNSEIKLSRISEIYDYLQMHCGKLSCDCGRESFTAWLHETPIVFKKRNFTCEYPNGTEVVLRGNPELLEIIEMKCIAVAVIAGCVTGFIILNVVFGLIVLVWHNRWKIRYLLDTGRRNLNPYHPLEECQIEMEYDVYISYERDSNVLSDETLHVFVTQTLYAGLKRQGFKVLIRDDLEPGMGLYNVISRALRRCKKVIALISRDYCTDYWNVFEFNTAVLEGIYTRRQVLIPIAFENIGREDLHADVYAFLKSVSVPYYSGCLPEADFISYLIEKINDNREFEFN